MAEGERIIPINIEDQMKNAYIDYSMSVIVSRALPDVRDGLKPVHRRVLYGMQDLGLASSKPYKKSARIVGEVLGKYHPHGDSSVYDAMVRMAQEWSLRYPMVEGQGNFGSVEGDSPAAMRYTEARLRKIAEEMLADIDKETVDFSLNFDDSLEEPTVLPAKIPNLLVNGASGIAVGMATNMAPHNLSEVIDGIVAYIDDTEIEIDELIKYIKAPDFPTGGIIYGYDGVVEAFKTGRGRIVMRAKTEIEAIANGKEQIVVTELPYQVNPADMVKKTAELVNDKKIEGIVDIRIESDRKGTRIVYELKRNEIANVVLNKLFKYTQLQTSFSVNNICLVKGRPMLLNLKQMIKYFVEHRHDVVVRRTQYELRKAQERAHILEGLLIVLESKDNLDRAIAIIREAESPDLARQGLMATFSISEIQASAILDMRLRTLTGLQRDKIREEYDELMKQIDYYSNVLADVTLRMSIIKNELLEIKDKYGDARRSEIVFAGGDMKMEDLIADEAVVVTISHMGYIKRTSLSEYKRQTRGGVGSRASSTRDEDFLAHLISATNHNNMLFFTEKGKCYWLKVYELPEGTRQSKGRAIQNLINIEPDDKVKAYITVGDLNDQEYINNNFIIMCTKGGTIKKTSLESYSRPRVNGINAINVKEGDELIEAILTNGSNEIMIAVKSGRAIRFNESTVRPMGRTATGVKAISLDKENDEVVGMIGISDASTQTVLVVSQKGFGKRTFLNDPEDNEPVYRVTNRGGKGVKTISVTDKTGLLISLQSVTEDDDLMIITKKGTLIRMAVSSLRVMGRATQGVKLINLRGDDEIAAVTKVAAEEEEPEIVSDAELNVDGENINPENGDTPTENDSEPAAE